MITKRKGFTIENYINGVILLISIIVIDVAILVIKKCGTERNERILKNNLSTSFFGWLNGIKSGKQMKPGAIFLEIFSLSLFIIIKQKFDRWKNSLSIAIWRQFIRAINRQHPHSINITLKLRIVTVFWIRIWNNVNLLSTKILIIIELLLIQFIAIIIWLISFQIVSLKYYPIQPTCYSPFYQNTDLMANLSKKSITKNIFFDSCFYSVFYFIDS